MPKAWSDTVDAHRSTVRGTVLDAAWGLVVEHGVRAVTMGQVASAAGIGRATLYKYFRDLDAILVAWHDRQVDAHLAELVDLGAQPGSPLQRLTAVLHGWVRIAREGGRHGPELAAVVHHQQHTGYAEERLDDLLEHLLSDAVREGGVRTDIAARELARYCRHALGAATELAEGPPCDHLVTLTLAACRAPADSA